MNLRPLGYEPSIDLALAAVGIRAYRFVVDHEQTKPLTAPLPAGHVDSLEHLSSELAAAALTDLFLRTGSAQARVGNADEIRRLVRLDCRRRGCRVRTLGRHGVVAVYDEERYEAFLATEQGAEYRAEMERRMLSAFPSFSAPSPSLRLVRQDGDE